MNFVGPFPESDNYNYLWVVICRLTLMVHLVPICTTTKASDLTWLYVHEIIHLHGLLETIVSDRDSKFTSRFWCDTHKLLGTKLLMSTSFHPQTDGASECAIRSIAQILRVMVHPDQKDWTEKILMTEFTLNSAISSSSGFAPFELNDGYPLSVSPGFVLEPGTMPRVKHFIAHALWNLSDAHDTIIESRVLQMHNVNHHRHHEDLFAVSDHVYVSSLDLSLLKGRASKLLPKYIGPFRVLDANPSTSSYKIKLPTQLRARHLHDRFHQSKLWPYHANDDSLFLHQEGKVLYDFGTPDDQEWLVDEIQSHKWDGDVLMFQVHWNLSDTTWESVETCNKLHALNDYLALLGTADLLQLPQRISQR